MEAVGNPVPSYHWKHNGKTIVSSDSGYTSKVTVASMDVADYGNYTLTLNNKAGRVSYVYTVLAEG